MPKNNQSRAGGRSSAAPREVHNHRAPVASPTARHDPLALIYARCNVCGDRLNYLTRLQPPITIRCKPARHIDDMIHETFTRGVAGVPACASPQYEQCRLGEHSILHRRYQACAVVVVVEPTAQGPCPRRGAGRCYRISAGGGQEGSAGHSGGSTPTLAAWNSGCDGCQRRQYEQSVWPDIAWPSCGTCTLFCKGCTAAVRGGMAGVELDLLCTRTAEGRERAMARRVKLGRPPKLTRPSSGKRRRAAAGEPIRDVARTYNVQHSTVSRLLA